MTRNPYVFFVEVPPEDLPEPLKTKVYRVKWTYSNVTMGIIKWVQDQGYSFFLSGKGDKTVITRREYGDGNYQESYMNLGHPLMEKTLKLIAAKLRELNNE